MKIHLTAYILPDEGPRVSRWHKKIVRIHPIIGTRIGNWLVLECGHTVQHVGPIAHADGVLLCTECREWEEGR